MTDFAKFPVFLLVVLPLKKCNQHSLFRLYLGPTQNLCSILIDVYWIKTNPTNKITGRQPTFYFKHWLTTLIF